MNHFCFFGIYAGLAMLMLMIMPSLIAGKFKINVIGDKETNVYVKKTDTVLTVKKKIVEELNSNNIIHKLMGKWKVPEGLTLRPYKNGPVFKDQNTMKGCGIVPEEFACKHAHIFLGLDEFEIKVKYEQNEFPVWVKNTDTVLDFKYKIMWSNSRPKEMEGIPYTRLVVQSTTAYGVVVQLDDIHKKLENYGIAKDASVNISVLLKEEMLISIISNSTGRREKFDVSVKRTETVATLKHMIKEKIENKNGGIQLKYIELKLGYSSDWVLDDNEIIYGIKMLVLEYELQKPEKVTKK